MGEKVWQDYLAIYAALVATISLGWQAWSVLRDRPRLALMSVPPNHKDQHTLSGEHPDRPWFCLSYPIAFSNKGRQPVTILFAKVILTISREGCVVYDGKDRNPFPEGTFPLRLDPGEAKETVLLLRLEASAGKPITGNASGNIEGDLLIGASTTIGELDLKTHFKIWAGILNQRRLAGI